MVWRFTKALGKKTPYISISDVLMSRDGIEYVEKRADIDKTLSGVEKVRRIGAKAAEWGLEQLKDVSARILSEMINKQIGH